MDTDIHMVAEIRKNGIWKTMLDNIFTEYKNTSFETETCVPYSYRTYDVFAILADVRNGTGFAGVKTGERFNVISKLKGYPKDMNETSKTFVGDEWGGHHSASYLTLKEIFDFDWDQLHRGYGCLTEIEYKESIMQGKHPECWCGDASGPDLITLSEENMVDLIQGKYKREKEKRYQTKCFFPPETYAECAEYFLENMNIFKKYVLAKGGTLEDGRIIFDFDN